MLIKWMDVKPHPGGLVKMTVVVEGDIKQLAKAAQETQSRPYELTLKAQTHKRSLTANGYYQVLLDKLTAAVGGRREVIHRELLGRYGVTDTDASGTPILLRMKADIDPMELTGVYLEGIGSQDGYIIYRVLKGSSKMDSTEFAHLLDGLISECKELGIEVLPDEELQRLYQVQES